jgi:hypothetical protein
LLVIVAAAPVGLALDGLVNSHDPSTVIQYDGKAIRGDRITDVN